MNENEIPMSLNDAIELWRGIYESSRISSPPSTDESMDESND